MNRKSASTLIYFHDRTRRKKLYKRPKHINREKRTGIILTGLWVVIILALIPAGTWFYKKYRPLDIKAVTIEGAHRFVNEQDVKKMAEEKTLNKNVIFTDIQNLKKTISGNFLACKEVNIARRTFRTLHIKITERVPIALIEVRGSGNGAEDAVFYFVDTDGLILGIADKATTNLPVINYGQSVEIGKFVEPVTVKYYFDLIKALDADGVFASTISSYPRYISFSTTDNTEVLFSNFQSPKSQVKIYNKMMESFKAEGKRVRKIDLRYDKVIVEFIN